MKTQLRISKKNGTYTVGGETLQEAKNKLGSGEWGHFHPIAGKVNPKLDKSKKVVSVEIVGGHSIEMPVWTGYKKAPKVCQETWDRMWKALEKHELDHGMVYQEALVKFEITLSGIAEGTIGVDELSKLVAKAMAVMEQMQDKFESDTDHGRNRGVVLDPPADCM
jgi:predicted secreted Zn-dependent protease